MPRPNQPRTIRGEELLSQRIKVEREARGWTFDGLAARMAEAGCPIQGSAVYKIERASPPRRITVDELVGFARVFELPIGDLLLPAEVVLNRRARELFDAYDTTLTEVHEARVRNAAALDALVDLLDSLSEETARKVSDEAVAVIFKRLDAQTKQEADDDEARATAAIDRAVRKSRR